MQRGQGSALNGGNIQDRRRSTHRDAGLRGDGLSRPERPSKPGSGSRPGGQGGGGYGHFGGGGGGHGRPERPDSHAGSSRVISHGGVHQVERERPLDEKLNGLATCLIGQWVDVQIMSGQWYTAIFHSCGDTEEGFGVKLKMARLRDAKGGKGPKNDAAVRVMPMGDMKVSGKDFVQIVAKDVNLAVEPSSNGKPKELKEEIATDTALSRGRLGGAERELTPWKPEGGDEVPRNMRLEPSGWGSSRSQGWDQFEVNAQLFGVQSTFDEELYTTKLEKKNTPEAKEREREAIRIAREIESQSTRNIHLAEERGQKLDTATEAMGEEARYSSVIRAKDDADAGTEEEEDDGIDTRNDETFGDDETFGNGHTASAAAAEPKSPPPSSIVFGKSLSSSALSTPVRLGTDGDYRGSNGLVKDGQSPLRDRRTASAEKSDLMMGDGLAKLRLRLTTSVKGSSKGGRSPYHSPMGRSPLMSPLVGDAAVIHMLNLDPSCPNVSEDVVRDFHEFKNAKAGKRRFDEELSDFKSFSLSLKDRAVEPRSPLAAARPLHLSSASPANSRPSSSGSVRSAQPLSVSSGALPPSTSTATATNEPSTSTAKSDKAGPTPPTSQAGSTTTAAPAVRPSSLGAAPPVSSTASTVSPTSSATSSAASSGSTGASSKKTSSLNPNAKEFKLNPNARAFTPNVPAAPVRPAPPVTPQSTPVAPPPHAVPPPTGPSVFVPNGMPHSVGIPLSPMPQFIPPGQQFQNYPAAVVNATPGTYPIGLQGGFIQGGVPQVTGQMFAQQQIRGFSPQAAHMQPQLFYPAGQMPQYPPPGVMYGQGQPVVYLQMPGQQHMMAQQAIPQQPGPPPPQGGGLQYQPSPQIIGGGQHGMQHPHMAAHMGQGPMQQQMAQGGMPGGPGGGNGSGRVGRGGGGGGGQQQLPPQ